MSCLAKYKYRAATAVVESKVVVRFELQTEQLAGVFRARQFGRIRFVGDDRPARSYKLSRVFQQYI